MAKKRPGMEFLNSMAKGVTVTGINITAPVANKAAVKKQISTEQRNQLYLIVWAICKDMNIAFEAEYRFHKVRKFKFDWAIPGRKIAIEYEGIRSEKSRHTTLNGYSRDTEKYNLASMEGWQVLRYTSLTIKNAGADLLKLLENG